jgi:hypothetical protein
MDFEGLMASAEGQGKTGFLERMSVLQQSVAAFLGALDRDRSVGEILASLNCPEGLWASHALYMEFLDVDDGESFVGASLVEAWLGRNLRIFSNIKRLTEPGDRVLVLYGAGHAKLLSDLVSSTKSWRLEDPMRYLPQPPATHMAL